MELPFSTESDLEARIVADPAWQEGARWGEPRPGHPEGSVASHIAEVVTNVDRHAIDQDDRARLRLVALVHDTFKYQVDQSKPKSGDNHHAMLARRFAEGYVEDPELLDVIELHDEASTLTMVQEEASHSPTSCERDPTLMLARVEIDHEVSWFQVSWIRDSCDPAVLGLIKA